MAVSSSQRLWNHGVVVVFGLCSVIHSTSLAASPKTSVTAPASRKGAPLVSGSVTLQQGAYVSSDKEYFREQQPASESTLQLELNASWRKPSAKSQVSLTFEHRSEEENSYVSLPEAYYKKQSSRGQLAVGRKLELWSSSGQRWRRGLWQARSFWDELSNDPQGLTGLFFQRSLTSSLQVKVLASPMFIPEQGASFDVRNGQVVSSNPWFTSPPGQVLFKDVPTKVNYSVIQPSIEEVVFQPGGALQLGWTGSRSQALVSYGYKPINQLMLAAEVEQRTSSQGPIPVHIDIHPRVVYHQLASIENRWNYGGGWYAEWGVTHEVPELGLADDNWVAQNTTDATVLDMSLGFDSESSPGKVKSKWYLGAMKLYGGDAADIGDFANEESSLFERRYQFQQALRAGVVRSNFRLFERSASFTGELTYDFAQRGAVLTSSLMVQVATRLRAQLSADFLGLVDDGPAEVDDGFLATYRANDRVQAGVSYVF